MSTVLDVITDAMYACGAMGQDQASPSSGDAELCRRRLVRLVARWANENLLVYTAGTSNFPTVVGTAGYATSLLSLGRPVTIQNVYVRLNGIDYPVDPIGEEDYNGIPYKAAQGLPIVYFFDTSYPSGAITFYPTPNAIYTVYVNGRYPITSSLALSDTVSLPEGYESALVDALAMDICPSFGVQPSNQLVLSARAAKAGLKKTNFVPQIMSTGLGGEGATPDYIRILGDT